MTDDDIAWYYGQNHGWVKPNNLNLKAPCGGPDNCATCRAEAEDVQIEKKNQEFDEQLWTFIAVREDGTESVLYGHATNNVFIYALAKAHEENSHLVVKQYVKPVEETDLERVWRDTDSFYIPSNCQIYL